MQVLQQQQKKETKAGTIVTNIKLTRGFNDRNRSSEARAKRLIIADKRSVERAPRLKDNTFLEKTRIKKDINEKVSLKSFMS